MSHSEKKQSVRSKTSYGGSISELESDGKTEHSDKYYSDKYHKIAKKLAKDKDSLKDKMRRLLDEVDHKAKEQRKEIEYFQEQISDLVEERNKAQDEVEKMRNFISEEKERYDDKILRAKEAWDKKYGNKDSQTVKRLENTITVLQERLNKQAEEYEKNKETTDQYYSQREEKLNKTVTDLEEQLRKTHSLLNKDHKDVQILTRTFIDEKEQIIRQMKKEKDEEIKQILSEKNTAILTLQGIREQMEKRTKIADKERDDQITQIKFDLEKTKIDYERATNEQNLISRKKLEEFRLESEGKLFEASRIHKIDIENRTRDFEKKIEIINNENSRYTESLTSRFQKESEDFKIVTSKLQADLDSIKSHLDQEISKREDNLKRTHEKIVEKLTITYQGTLETKEKELNELRLRDDKITGEMGENNQRLKEQISHLKENMKKLQDNSQDLSSQFIINLNKQKEIAEKEISDRDQTISQLERRLKKLGEETVDKFNVMDRRLNNTLEELKEMTEKYSSLKSAQEKIDQTSSYLKSEAQKFKEVAEKTIERNKQILFEKETVEKRLQTIETENRNRENDISKIRVEYTRLSQAEFTMREEKNRLTREIDMLRVDLIQRKKEIESSNFSLTALREEYNKMKFTMSEELKLKVISLSGEKDKIVAELSVKIANLEQTVKAYEQEKAQSMANLMNSANQIDKLKRGIENFTQENERRMKTIQEITGENNNIKANFLETMREISCKDQELLNLRQQVKTIEFKDEQILNLTTQLNTTQQNYKHTLDRLATDHKKDRDELVSLRQKINDNAEQMTEFIRLKSSITLIQESTKSSLLRAEEEHRKELSKLTSKLNESEIKNTQLEQRIEQVKLDFLRKLHEAKQLPPEDQKKLLDLEKEHNEMSIHLSATEKKLNQVQVEFANASATIKSKMQFLAEREEEIRKESIRLRNEPAKLLDPSLKTQRDNAFAQLRQYKIEFTKYKEDTLEITHKLQIAETIAKELGKEKTIILEAQKELKETFLNNLNQQQAKHQQELEKRDERINQLEKILTERLNTN